ncbi:MAG: GTPase domain-containing protein [Candidatus Cloacimonetes bacterium]|nr:GTPase domain-containing protein [Candidatus Cloacimonadota bacterium]
MPWISEGCLDKLAIVGICKNAGKTTILNAIMQQHNGIKWGVMSTGRDGEVEDVLFKTPKPRVHIHPGSVFCADAKSMDAHGSAISLLKKTAWLSGGKPLWLARAESEIKTEIGGPQSVSAQIACANELLKLGAEKVIIDGSLDRKSIALSEDIDGLILAVGASFGNIAAIQNELLRLVNLAEIPCYTEASAKLRKTLLDSETIHLKTKGKWHNTGLKSLLGAEKQFAALLSDTANCSHIYIPSAFTSTTNARLGKQITQQLIFRHPECLKLPLTELESFVTKHHPLCLISIKIRAIALNANAVGASSVDADLLRKSMRSAFPHLELIDIMEIPIR